MVKNVKNTVIKQLLFTAIIPLFIFSFVFFGQIFDFFMRNDTENINTVLQREQKYITNLVNVNIEDMKLIAISDNVKTEQMVQVVDVFNRFMSVRNDIVKMKLVFNDGIIIEADKGKPSGIEYKKSPLDVIETSCLARGEYAMYSGDEEDGQYIIFSAPYIVDNKIKAVVMGYMPASQIQFVVSDINLNTVGDIYIKDSRGNYLFKHSNSDNQGKNDMELPIDKTDWTLAAKIDYKYFQNIIYESVLLKIIIFLILVVIFIIPFSIYIANFLKEALEEITSSAKSMKKIDSEVNSFFEIEEIKDFKKNYNRIIDLVNNRRLLENRSYIDRLTGLYTERYIEDWLHETITSYNTSRIYFIIIEVNMLKKADTNQGNSSASGNAVLAETGKIIKENIRFGDLAIRFEEEKFLIILTEVELQRAREVKERIILAVKSYGENLQGISIKTAAGISKYEGDIYQAILNSSKALNHEKRYQE